MVKLLYSDSTGCNGVEGDFATETDTMTGIIYEDDLGEF